MHFDKTNFYHHFNRTKQTYSLDEIIFTLEIKGRYKGERFKEKNNNKTIIEKDLFISN